MAIEFEIGYRRDETIEIIRSAWVSEDEKYLYLEAGRFVKTRIVSLKRITPTPVDDEDEED